ncbi:class A beta-lactamase-related serine hydrolase [Kribbella antibiotica]|uniref:Class A beta-lactamase-related serine hydrolase n=1 Tax=Kribbella antibiotica TaxID=190195 RepID=A0A4R4ZN08_9ACTN|nr:serine hydrolase domain-containing protein [Kribbella antibiotica]TDD59099.1 class A beta-lactamase-related serine hydrolase [Kribbella antibiotica]
MNFTALLASAVLALAPVPQLQQLVDDGAASTAVLAVGAQSSAAGPITPDAYFRIGSVTKTFVATAVLQLVDEQRVRLDAPIERYLPGVVPGGRRITVRQVLDHTSGIYDYAHDPGWSTNRWRGSDRFQHYEPSQLLTVAFSHPPYFPPGTGWHYSNTNYILAGLLIERVTGRPYGAEIVRRIVKPLALTHTSLPGDWPGLPTPHAPGYTSVDGKLVDATLMNPSLDWAAGEMISTTADLNRFFAALFDARLTSRAALAEMRRYVPATGLFDYGLGLQRFRLPCGTTVEGHSGELLGYTTYSTHSGATHATLSYNPLPGGDASSAVIGLFTAVHCE